MGLGKGNGKGGCRQGAGRPAGARGKAVIEREALDQSAGRGEDHAA